MYSELFLTAEENANYNLQFWNHAGELIEELSNVSGTFKIPSNVMLVKGKKIDNKICFSGAGLEFSPEGIDIKEMPMC